MAQHWMHLLPVDRYIIRASDLITEADKKIISLLYQPLVGAVAHSLYLTLLHDLQTDQFTSEETSHKTLMMMMGLSLDQIFEERKKLEGIGLLNVFKKENGEDVTYLYELQKPFSTVEFFKDDLLSVYLYNRVGKVRYLQLRERFSIDKIDQDGFTEITNSFHDVFTSLHHSELAAHQGELSSTLAVPAAKEVVGENSRQSYSLLEDKFDFSLLIKHLSNVIDANALLTQEVKDTIIKLAFVYRIEPFEMSRILQDSLIQDDTVDIDVMREKVKSWYRITYTNEPPALGLRTQPEHLRTVVGKEPQTEEEEIIFIYETESPLSLLERKSDGAKVPPSDVKLIESLLIDYKLLPGVVNVLVDYVLKINDMKLTKGYVESVASQWIKKNFKTVKEAMDFAKEEFKKRKQWQQGAKEVAATKEKQVRHTKKSNYVRQDRLPKWLTESNKEQPAVNEEEIELDRKELQDKLNLLKSKRQKGV